MHIIGYRAFFRVRIGFVCVCVEKLKKKMGKNKINKNSRTQTYLNERIPFSYYHKMLHTHTHSIHRGNMQKKSL